MSVYVEQLGTGDPEVAVVGGIHGDEPAGPHAIRTLLEERPDVERPVTLIVANEKALERGTRFVDSDLNRSFPGEEHTDLHERRLAHRLGEEIGHCTTLALHTTQSFEEMFAVVDGLGELERSICPSLSIEAVVETRGTNEGRIFESVPNTIEVECGYQGSEQAKDNAVTVTREFLRATGVLPGPAPRRRESLPVFKLGRPIQKAEADEYEVYANNFEEVAAGTAYARAGDEQFIADEAFHPVLMSSYGYDDLFGYTAELVDTL